MCRLRRQFRAWSASILRTEPMIIHSSVWHGSETQSSPCLIGAKPLGFCVPVDGDIRSFLIREGYFTDKTAAARPELESEQINVAATLSEEMRIGSLESTNSEVRDYD